MAMSKFKTVESASDYNHILLLQNSKFGTIYEYPREQLMGDETFFNFDISEGEDEEAQKKKKKKKKNKKNKNKA